MKQYVQKKSDQGFRARLHEIIFEADTPAGKTFDVVLIVVILLSVAAVMLDSVQSIRAKYGHTLTIIEWVFTILFTIEYVLRLYSVGRPLRYATSFFGIIDLLSFLPTYLTLLIPGTQYFAVIRIMRVLRVFRVLKLVGFVKEANHLMAAFRASARKIIVFLFLVLTLVVIFGSLMYVIEGEENGFTSIPRSIYWAVVTMTTVGFGDISPRTALGQTFAALIMIMGFSIIAVPTGIVSAELQNFKDQDVSTQACPQCAAEGHDTDASHCKKCGASL